MKTEVHIPRKDQERQGLMKVPDEIIIRQLREEAGKREAYILELEETIERLKDDEVVRKLENENKSLRGTIRAMADHASDINKSKTIRRLREDAGNLICEIAQLRRKLEEYEK